MTDLLVDKKIGDLSKEQIEAWFHELIKTGRISVLPKQEVDIFGNSSNKRSSTDVDKIYAALFEFQKEVTDIPKEKVGALGRYKYAELSSVLETIRPLLIKNNLFIVQNPLSCLDNPKAIELQTVIAHTSGQWIGSSISMEVDEGRGMSKAQAAGSVITYARRYAIVSMLNIAQVDDDASLESPTNKATSQKIPYQTQKLSPQWAASPDKEKLLSYFLDYGIENPQFEEAMRQQYKISSLRDLPISAYKSVEERIKKKKGENHANVE